MLAIILLFGCIVAAWSAPLDLSATPEIKQVQQIREFLIFTPEAQLRLQAPYKLEQSIIQPLALYGSPGTRQSSSDICNQILNFPTTFPFPFPGQGGSGGSGGSGDSGSTDDSGSSDERIGITQQRLPEMNADAERIPQAMLPLTPASTIPLPERRFYTIAGRPQFFGNQHALLPIFSLQPLQAIKARSVAIPEAEIVQSEKNTIATVSEALPSPQPLRITDQNDQLQAIVPGVMYRREFASPQEKQIIDTPNGQDLIAQEVAAEQPSKLDEEATPTALFQDSIVAKAAVKAELAPEANIEKDARQIFANEAKKPVTEGAQF